MEDSVYVVIRLAVGLTCNLKGVQGGGRADLMWFMASHLKHLMRIGVRLDGSH